MPMPKMDGIIKLLEAKKPFSLTNSQYKKLTGLDIPKTIRTSLVWRKARKYQFIIVEKDKALNKLVNKERSISFERED